MSSRWPPGDRSHDVLRGPASRAGFGPGGARGAGRAGADVVLIEGPPEADALVPHVDRAHPAGRAARARAGAAGRPRSGRSPCSRRSGRRCCMRPGGRPVRFIDLPAAGRWPIRRTGRRPRHRRRSARLAVRRGGLRRPGALVEDVVEHRLGGDPLELFAAIAEAMAELRAAAAEDGWRLSRREAQREAAMRNGIRAAAKAGHASIAVICGAWHVPALRHAADGAGRCRAAARAAVGQDARDVGAVDVAAADARERLWRGRRVARLVRTTCGATPDQIAERWVVRAARLLRARHARPPGAVLEAVRLAQATPRCAAGPAGADRADRRDPGGLVPRRRGAR